MDKKYLDKVVGQIVRETRMDYDERWLYTPFRLPVQFINIYFPFSPTFHFSQHCKEVYGLNIEEIDYVWEEYKHIIIDKIPITILIFMLFS